MKKTLLFGLLLFNVVFVFGQSISKTIQLLPDTGQTISYTPTFGEDNDYLINTPSYTNNGDGTITDNVSGLMWQQVDGGEMTIENAKTYCDNLVLGGHSDWRLPVSIEAFSILNHQNNNPAMNTTYFPSSGAEYWWTSVFELNSTTKVWCTNAGGGIGNHPKTETISAGGTKKFHARAVRNTNTPPTLTIHFTDNGDGTITDNLTQLIWQKVPNTSALTWENALKYAEGLSLGNSTDWRLPNIKELQSLNNELATNPSVFSPYFGNLGVYFYWSSTSLPNQTTKAWYWSTQFGITTYDTKTNANYVICVRGNPTLTVQNEAVHNSIKVYPNPASNYIVISFVENPESPVFEFSNSLGQIVLRKEMKVTSNEYRLNTEKLSNGFYVLTVINGKKRDSFKIVITK
ncbi:Lcl domain-containing protein [Flavobacterium luteum]|uniref:DUF1566 domain-containing protein n=1 Tax=Flavobacterium luteum TaxID=2026654 RepID=A0A7J5AHQ5_9FLAO|nr:DUF1566 domain-containing protein [Flavobacterium luteum]KAB1156938.1 DUF1566 domain-containing protein [Flavobacterium luteum]